MGGGGAGDFQNNIKILRRHYFPAGLLSRKHEISQWRENSFLAPQAPRKRPQSDEQPLLTAPLLLEGLLLVFFSQVGLRYTVYSSQEASRPNTDFSVRLRSAMTIEQFPFLPVFLDDNSRPSTCCDCGCEHRLVKPCVEMMLSEIIVDRKAF